MESRVSGCWRTSESGGCTDELSTRVCGVCSRAVGAPKRGRMGWVAIAADVVLEANGLSLGFTECSTGSMRQIDGEGAIASVIELIVR